MKAHIISLPDSSRKKTTKYRLNNCNYTAVFHDAIDTRYLNRTVLEDQFDFEGFKDFYGYYPSSSEVGCVLSHYKVYRYLAKLNSKDDYFLIVEDDCIPLLNSKKLKNIILSSKDISADIVILGYSKVDNEIYKQIQRANPIKILKNIDNGKFKIGVKYIESQCGAVAYLVSREFIKKLATIQKPKVLADEWPFYKNKMEAKIVHISPLSFLEDYMNMESTQEGQRGIDSQINLRKVRLPKYLRPIWQHTLGIYRRFLMWLKYTFDL